MNDSNIPFEDYSKKQHYRAWQQAVENANKLAADRGDSGFRSVTADVGGASVLLNKGCFRKLPTSNFHS